MPGGDRTGPMGMGPMTGRAAGYCAGSGVPGYTNPVYGRGFGSGIGRGLGRGRGAWGRGFGGGGFGWRNAYYAEGLPLGRRFGGYAVPYGYAASYQEPNSELEKSALKNQAEALQSELDFIKKRLAEIEAGKEEN